jgi:hypothetical protein
VGNAPAHRLLGALLSPGVLGKVGMAIELGRVLAGVATPILVAMLLDEQTPRVPRRTALGITRE